MFYWKYLFFGGNNVIDLTPSGPTANRHEIISSSSLPLNDFYAGFPRHCPYGGNYSVKLGNDQTNSEAEGLSYTFQIPPSADTFSLTYFYAVVFQDPGHPISDQPRFFVTAYNVATGALINCASYNYISTAAIPGFQVSTVDPMVLYKDWTPASIDFSGLAGQTVRLEFKTADCTQGAHFGYAYVDVSTGCGGVITVAALCGAANSVVLNAPYGFQTYTWYNANYSVVVGNQQNVTLIPAPPANTMFHVDMIPYPGFGCRDTADALVTALPVPDTPVAITNYDYCQNDPPQVLTATTTSPNAALLWYTAATGGVGNPDPPLPSTVSPGVTHYYVSQKVLFGCEGDRTDIAVHVIPTPVAAFSINNVRQCENSNNFIFTNNTTNAMADVEYTWDFGDASAPGSTINSSHTYNSYGNFNVTLTALNPPACPNDIIKQVLVIAKPVAQFSYTQTICEHQTPIILADNSMIPGSGGTINQWHWTIGAVAVNVQNPPSFLANGGQLPVHLVVGTSEGCLSDTNSQSLRIHYGPAAKFKYGPLLCDNEVIQLTDLSAMPAAALPDHVIAWDWTFDNGTTSILHNPAIILPAGIHHVKLISQSDIGCKSVVADSIFTVYEKPHIGLSISDSCVYRRINFSAISSGTNAVVDWFWDFGNGYHPDAQQLHWTFHSEGYDPVKLLGQTIRGCKDTINRPFTIYQNHAFAGHDTTAAFDQPVQLHAGGTDIIHYAWAPSNGLTNPNIINPVALLDIDQLYELNTIDVHGCDSHDEILIKRYKGPELFIPSAFTPNADGRNDALKVFPVGIKVFYSFAVYNRFGVCLFYTTDYSKGWDGTYKGAPLDAGSYVYHAKAQDYGKGAVEERKCIVDSLNGYRIMNKEHGILIGIQLRRSVFRVPCSIFS